MSTTVTTSVYVDKRSYNSEMRRVKLPGQRSGPLLSIKSERKNRILKKEQEEFMAGLARDREIRGMIEQRAATKLQAAYRGSLRRPKKALRRSTKGRTDRTTIRSQLQAMSMDMDRQLEIEMDQAGDDTPEWRKSIQRKAAGKQQMKRMKEVGNLAAVRAQSVVRGFLARRGWIVMVKKKQEEIMMFSATLLQSYQRGFYMRRALRNRKELTRRTSIVQMQRRVRGMLDREYVRLLRLQMREKSREDAKATKIQAQVRRRQSMHKVERARQARAATVLQQGAQRYNTRSKNKKRQVEQHSSATKLQTQFRGSMLRRKKKKKKGGA
jgi:hypothetical protein